MGGALGDRYGRRRVFVIGTAWFAVASLLCGIAPSIEILIAARVLQGVGGALLTPGSLAIIQASFREQDRAAAVGLWSGLGGIAGAIGPFVGGFLVDGPGWRWAFLVNVPVAALVVVCAAGAIPESRDPTPATSTSSAPAIAVVDARRKHVGAHRERARAGWTDPAIVVAARRRGRVGVAAFVRPDAARTRSARPAGAVRQPQRSP